VRPGDRDSGRIGSSSAEAAPLMARHTYDATGAFYGFLNLRQPGEHDERQVGECGQEERCWVSGGKGAKGKRGAGLQVTGCGSRVAGYWLQVAGCGVWGVQSGVRDPGGCRRGRSARIAARVGVRWTPCLLGTSRPRAATKGTGNVGLDMLPSVLWGTVTSVGPLAAAALGLSRQTQSWIGFGMPSPTFSWRGAEALRVSKYKEHH
jgi:hypothetical protein